MCRAARAVGEGFAPRLGFTLFRFVFVVSLFSSLILWWLLGVLRGLAFVVFGSGGDAKG